MKGYSKYFNNFQVKVEIPAKQNILSEVEIPAKQKKIRLRSPRGVPKILWRIQVVVVSEGQILLEERPVISADSI